MPIRSLRPLVISLWGFVILAGCMSLTNEKTTEVLSSKEKSEAVQVSRTTPIDGLKNPEKTTEVLSSKEESEAVQVSHSTPFDGHKNLKLTGVCPPLPSPKNWIVDANLQGYYRKFSRAEKNNSSMSASFQQIIALPAYNFQFVNWENLIGKTDPVKKNSFLVQFLPLEDDPDGSFYLGIVRKEKFYLQEAFYREDEFYRQDEFLSNNDFSCEFLIFFLSHDGMIMTSPLGLQINGNQTWADLEQLIAYDGGKLEGSQGTAVLQKGWAFWNAERLLMIFRDPKFRAYLSHINPTALLPEFRGEDLEKLANLYYQQVLAYFKANEFRLALEQFDQVLRFMPTSLRIHLMKMASFFSLKQYDKGIQELDEGLAIRDPQEEMGNIQPFRDALLLHGLSYEKDGKHGQAFRIYERATQLEPQDGKAEYAYILLSVKTQGARGMAMRFCDKIENLKYEYRDCHTSLRQSFYPPEASLRSDQTFEGLMKVIVGILGVTALVELSNGQNQPDGGPSPGHEAAKEIKRRDAQVIQDMLWNKISDIP